MSNNREENALWSIFGYLISGLLFWGGAGWARPTSRSWASWSEPAERSTSSG